MTEERVPQVGQDPLARPAREVRLRGVRSEVQDADQQKKGDDDRQRVQVVLRDPVVDRELRQVRRRERGRRRREECDDRERGLALVRRGELRERRHAADRPLPRPVVDLRPALLHQPAARLVDLHATSSISPRASTASANCRSSRPCS